MSEKAPFISMIRSQNCVLGSTVLCVLCIAVKCIRIVYSI
ncbi:hypothetical protein QTP70_025815 [Hemibagrus guttatus]|uniref:Uncharacterized protein n=1 Tax=Hemibagrus guttatus TaxID=175788 RepID=A0AAE0QTA7_9TELE|nr:hypothetical protein QTP70_025815 [Hemibagrus guttatus]